MSMDLYNSYAKDFEQCMSQLRDLMDSASGKKAIAIENPYEYKQA